MEHGGGNNSTFTTRVVPSSGTDTYSTIAAALGSLKGPKHGGANIKVTQMMADMKEHLPKDYTEEDVRNYLTAVLNKQAFDHKGLIYGMGHAIYSNNDPRASIFKRYVSKLAEEKGREYVHGLLKDIDEESYNKLYPNDLKRVIRALEVYKLTGKSISENNKDDDIYDIGMKILKEMELNDESNS